MNINIHLKSILAAFVFSFLFYSKSLGLNLLLISLVVVILLTTAKRAKPILWGYHFAYVFTALMVCIDPTGFKVFIHLMAFLVLIGKSISNTSSLYLSWAIGVINLLIASVAQFNRRISQPAEREKKLSQQTFEYLKGSLIAIILVVAFTLLYRNANPVFGDLVAQIDFSFISFPWLCFTLLGYFLFLHILRPYYPEDLIALDESQSNDLQHPKEPFNIPMLEKLRGEQTLGSIVFLSLNLLLIFFLVTDIIYLVQVDAISNSGYSQSVHEGVYALMLSIVCAILIILYFFRGDLNFYAGNKRIKHLTYLWIGLNTLLVAFTCYKNYQYVEALGLTYKRIGVFVYLLLTLTGLITAYIKVSQIKSFVFLMRTNLAAVFAFLLLSASIPWDRAITWYNLEHIENPDIAYLIDLGGTNSDQLYRYARENKANTTQDLKTRIGAKHTDFLALQEELTWQEYTLYQLKDREVK